MGSSSMSSKGDQDIDIDVALCNSMDSELNHYIEGLRGRIIDLNRKKEELDDLKKKLNEISIQYKDCKKTDKAIILRESLDALISGKIIDLSRKKEELDDVKKRLNEISIQYKDCKKKEEADILRESLDVLISEFYKIKDSIDPDLEVHSGTGGPSEEEGCKADDVKTGIEFNQSFERSSTERKRQDEFDMASDSTETEKESQEIQKQGGVKKRFLDNVAKSDSSDDPDEQPVSVDN